MIPGAVPCPVCGWDYVHPVALKAEPVNGTTVVYINRDGVRAYPTTIAERVRGIRITTSFICEEGHAWDEERAFHKGVTLQAIRRGPDWDDAEMVPNTMWRD